MNIKKLFNMQSSSEKIAEYRGLLKKSFEITKEISDLSKLFAEKSSIAKSFPSMDEKERVDAETRYNTFLDEHAKNVAALQRKREQIFKSLAKLSKDEEISDTLSDIYDLYQAKSEMKNGNISKSVYNDIIKAKTGVVRYSDVLLFRGNKMLILQRAGEYGASTQEWCIPGGHVDPGESFLEAAARELFEETGIEVPEDLLWEAGIAKGKDHEIHYFIGHVDDESPIQVVVDSEEEVGSTWINPCTELDDYDFIFDMKENISRILGLKCLSPVPTMMKAFAENKISERLFEEFCESHKEKIEREMYSRVSCIAKSYISEKEREKLEKEGKAMAGGRFPVRNVSDLRNAIKLVGNSDLPKADVIAYLKRRAKDLDAMNELPESWDEVEKTMDCDDANTLCKEDLDKETKGPEGDGIIKAQKGLEGFNILINFNDLDQAEMFKSLVDEMKESGKLDIVSIETKNEEIEKSWGVDEIHEEPFLGNDIEKAKDSMYEVFVDYANFLEGVKTRSKNVHWGEEDNSKHTYLDSLIDELSEYEDKIMEAGQSEFGRFKEGSVNGEEIEVNDPVELVDLIIEKTKEFYNKISDNSDYVGEKSWTEDFLATLKQTKYRLQMH